MKTDYKNDVFSGKRKYRMINNPDGTVSFDDVTNYTQIGDTLGAEDLNDLARQINYCRPYVANNYILVGDALIQWGYVDITPTSGSSPNYYGTASVSFPVKFDGTPHVTVSTASGYTDIKNVCAYNPTANGVSVMLVSSGQTKRGLRWLAIGKYTG